MNATDQTPYDEDPRPGDLVDDLLFAAKIAADAITPEARRRLRAGPAYTWCRMPKRAALALVDVVEAYDAAVARVAEEEGTR